MPPKAEIKPEKLQKHGHVRTDNYYWLSDRENPEVISYLEAENAYTDAMTAKTRELESLLFDEIKARIKQTDVSVPARDGNYYYYYRNEEDKAYRLYCRKKHSLDAPEEIILDVNELAEGEDHMRVRGRNISSDEDLMAYATDTAGRRVYTIYFKNLSTGEMLDDVIPNVTGGMAWANDNKTLFYAKQDLETLRSFQIYRHVLGTDTASDKLIYQEDDEEFGCYVWKTRSRDYIFVGTFQTLSSEYHYLDANTPTGEFSIVEPRQSDHEYTVDHYKDSFYILSNKDAPNRRLMKTPVDRTNRKHWEDVISHREDTYLSSFEIFDNHLVVSERRDALIHMRVMPWSGDEEHYIDFGEAAYAVYFGDNNESGTTTLRYDYSSMTTPWSTFDYNMETKAKTLLKQDEVLGGFDTDDYHTERIYATSRDGLKVPISIVYRKGLQRNGESPLVLYGYGSYGSSMNATFSSSRISLLDRGFVWAIAHIRGGQEYGRKWYDDGKMFNKKNTFTDFVDCAEHLIEEDYTRSDKIFAWGGSAGGLLMGAVVNMRPDLFNGIVADVPFVDVVTTMLDETIPLTTGEYDEWGDPNDKAAYEYMLSYSPYDNVEAKDYPNILVMTGLHDSQVQYFEPAKWVAKLRAMKTDTNSLLLKTDMEAGHSGGSGRFKRYRELAFQYSFLLGLIGHEEIAVTP